MSDPVIGPAPTAFRASGGRRPRGVVRINGKAISFLEFSVDMKGYSSGDQFAVKIDCWQQPEGYGLPWWDTAGTVRLECLIGYLDPTQDVGAQPVDLTSLVLGQVDTPTTDPIGGTITLTGRDLTALLVDARVSTSWGTVSTSSDVATYLANLVGLTPNVTETSIPVNTYYNNANSTSTREIPAWDLISQLARFEGFDAYVKGSTLYFGPPPNESDPSPYTISFGFDVNGRRWCSAKMLKLERSLILAGDIDVTVRSAQQWGATVIAKSSRSGTAKTGFPTGPAQKYVISKPNLTQAAAQQLAESRLADLAKFERIIEGTAEGDATLTPQRLIRLTGTDTSWDQGYFPDMVTHKFGMKTGYSMDFRAKNHSTDSDPAD